jgi:biotin carboxylase
VSTVLLLATTTGYQLRAFDEAAAALGVTLVLATDRCDHLEDPWADRAIPVKYHDIPRSIDAVVATCGNRPPDGIITVGDRPTVLAAHLAATFALPGNRVVAANASRNKLAAHLALRASGLPTAEFRVVHVDEAPEVAARATTFPAVIKPLALSGSRGVMRVDDAADFVAAFERLRQILTAPDIRRERDDAHDLMLVESFIPGREYAVEGLMTGGRFQLLALFDKPDPLDGPFFEETIYVTPSRAARAVQDQIAEAIARAARALGLEHGPLHGECRVDGTEVYVLEVAARPIGGLCARALRFREGTSELVSLEEVLLSHAVGHDVSGYHREVDASGVMMIPIPKRGVLRGVDGLDSARGVSGIVDIRITAKMDSLLMPLPEGRSYLGFIFARAADPAVVEQALRDAHAHLQFRIDREVVVTQPVTTPDHVSG